jgi:hypothetical protein
MTLVSLSDKKIKLEHCKARRLCGRTCAPSKPLILLLLLLLPAAGGAARSF